jgi:hypothetical protein
MEWPGWGRNWQTPENVHNVKAYMDAHPDLPADPKEYLSLATGPGAKYKYKQAVHGGLTNLVALMRDSRAVSDTPVVVPHTLESTVLAAWLKPVKPPLECRKVPALRHKDNTPRYENTVTEPTWSACCLDGSKHLHIAITKYHEAKQLAAWRSQIKPAVDLHVYGQVAALGRKDNTPRHENVETEDPWNGLNLWNGLCFPNPTVVRHLDDLGSARLLPCNTAVSVRDIIQANQKQVVAKLEGVDYSKFTVAGLKKLLPKKHQKGPLLFSTRHSECSPHFLRYFLQEARLSWWRLWWRAPSRRNAGNMRIQPYISHLWYVLLILIPLHSSNFPWPPLPLQGPVKLVSVEGPDHVFSRYRFAVVKGDAAQTFAFESALVLK